MIQYDDKLMKEIQNVDLEMAEYFVNFCDKNGLLCYLCGGGCIGAVRHEGFIPWDDDLDFFMPRDDYEELKREWKDTEKYALVYPTKDYNDHNMFITLRDKTTTMIKPYQADLDMVHGVSIDIFPLDGCPKGIKRKLQIIWGLIYQLFCSQVVPENHGKLVSFVGKTVLHLVSSPERRYAIWKYAEKRMSRYSIKDSEYITEICAGPGYMKNRYPRNIFEKAVYKKFEDTKMPIPIGYDEYLKMVFGDYRKLPPKEKRIPAHDAVKIDLNVPYTEYKGIYYCKNNTLD